MTDKRIMKTHEFKDAIFYRASCDCSSPECDLTLEIELDKEVDMIFLNLYKNLHWAAYWNEKDKWYTNLWSRVKCAIRILFTGYIKVEESFIFKGDEQIKHFIKALEEGMVKLNENE